MKAAVLYSVNDLRFSDVPCPVAGEGETLIKIMAAGICGSDVSRVFDKGAYHYPIIIGHEFAGLDEKTGRKAVIFPLLPCKKCAMCQIGEYVCCENYDYYGSRRDGGFAEYLAVKNENILYVDSNIAYDVLAMTEPAAVALHSVYLGDIKTGDGVLITGAGAIGLIMGYISKINGAAGVYFTDIDKRKLDYAKSLGFEVYEKQKIDVFIEGTGASSALEAGLEAVKPFGNVVLMGNPGGDVKISQKSYWHILRKQLSMKGSWNSMFNSFRNEWQIVLSLISGGRLPLENMISHRFALERCNEAFAVLKDKTEFANRVMFVN
ncbi:MAG: galactitol-1-phosphate 5-dehydrogenase [Oscillospiraceae bacterium]|nr:galactitol-1-phosphate 5-dehydrogenase [Oscillospiraceae bacterium]